MRREMEESERLCLQLMQEENMQVQLISLITYESH